MQAFLIFVEGLRREWMAAESAPNVARLAGEGTARAVRDPFGFTGTRAAVLYGRGPDLSGRVFLWEHDPPRSQFRSLRWLPGRCRSPWVARAMVRGINRLRRARDASAPPIWDAAGFARMADRFRFGEVIPPADPRYLPGSPSLLAGCPPRDALYLGEPAMSGRTTSLLRRFRRRFHAGVQVLWLDFTELAWAQVEWGPDSPYVFDVMREIDAAIGEVRAVIAEMVEEPHVIIVFGGHCPVPVDEHLDLERLLRLDDHPPALDYFLDATAARFWSDDPSVLGGIREALVQVPEGRVIEPDQVPALGCRYARPAFGDLLFLARPGVLVFPNFFQRLEPCRAARGYFPCPVEGGAAIVARGGPMPPVPDGPLEMVDLHTIAAAARRLSRAAGEEPAAAAR